MKPTPPQLAPEYEISLPLDVDIDAVIAPILARSTQSPVLATAPAAKLFDGLCADLPRTPVSLEEVLDELEQTVVTHSRRNAHPGFYGYVAGPGLPTDPLGHAMTAALNQNVVGYPGSPGATVVEQVVLGWFKQLTGFPGGAEGTICSGGSIANLSALAAALYDAIGRECIRSGLMAYSGPEPVIVAAQTTHFSVQRAAVLLGLGIDQVLSVETDDRFRMRPDALQAVLLDCVEEGRKPVCVVASAGCTLTGSVDPLADIVDICERHGVWLHVDAAYGGAGLLSDVLRPRFAGVERADSISMDLHKWFYLAFDGSVSLFRNPAAARDVFYYRTDYVQWAMDGPPEEHMFFHFGPELSRRSRALPAYLAFRYYGSEILARNVHHNHECAAYLAALVRQDPDMELVCAPDLSICCFRYRPRSLVDKTSAVDELNRVIRKRLQEQGDYLLSPTDAHNRPVLRVCICCHTTRAVHMEQLLHQVRTLGEELVDAPTLRN